MWHLVADAVDECPAVLFVLLYEVPLETREMTQRHEGGHAVGLGCRAVPAQPGEKRGQLSRVEIVGVGPETLLRVLQRGGVVASPRVDLRRFRHRRGPERRRRGRDLETVQRVDAAAQTHRRQAVVVVRRRIVRVDGESPPRQIPRALVVHRAIAHHRQVGQRRQVVRILLQAGLERRLRLPVVALPDPLLARQPKSLRRCPVEVLRRLEGPGQCVIRCRPVVQPVPRADAQPLRRHRCVDGLPPRFHRGEPKPG